MLELTNELVLSYRRLVLSIVNKYASSYNKEDLYQVGMKKLSEVVSSYNPNLGVKFSTYAHKHILGEILQYIREDKNMHISRGIISLYRKIKLASDDFYKENGYVPSTLELSSILNIPESKIIDILNISQNTESLDEILEYSDNITRYDKVISEEKVDNIDLISLKDALNDLDAEDRKLIYLRYYEDKTQTQLAKEMNISQVKVYRMERKILDELYDKIA